MEKDAKNPITSIQAEKIHKIFFSNIGYARGIDGSLVQHVARAGRHFYCPLPVQHAVLEQVRTVIRAVRPDICCFVEVDAGSAQNAGLNQIEALAGQDYPFHESAGKYGEGRLLGDLWPHGGKRNAFLARHPVPFERLYFSCGGKRLFHRLVLEGGVFLYFAHFSLNRTHREKQLAELGSYIAARPGEEAVVMADFNIMRGLTELDPLCRIGGLTVMNRAAETTFTFHKAQYLLDVCLCTQGLCERAVLTVIPQPYSDHSALLLDLKPGGR